MANREYTQAEREKADLDLVQRIPDLAKRYGAGRSEDFYFSVVANDLQCLNHSTEQLRKAQELFAQLLTEITDYASEDTRQNIADWLERNQ